MRGKFIAIEGPDGCGKTTLINELKSIVNENSAKVRFTREPGGTKISEAIRNMLLDIKNKEMTDLTEAYLYAAARLQNVEEFILPSLKEGYHVISDRFIMASVAYQGYGREKSVDLIKAINRPAEKIISDINYIVLMCTAEEGLLRKKGQQALDRLETEGLEFHKRVADAYGILAKEEGAIYIDASGTIEETLQKLVDALKALEVL